LQYASLAIDSQAAALPAQAAYWRPSDDGVADRESRQALADGNAIITAA
jgi:hypothetical protein